MSNMEKYLTMLQSEKAVVRYEACEELRVSENLPESALLALQTATNDINPTVAGAAKKALLHHSKPAISDQSPLYETHNSGYGTTEAGKPYEQGLPSTLVDDKQLVDNTVNPDLPWFDEGEDVVVNEIVAPDIIGQPIEVYYMEPFTGYGHIRFLENAISFGFPGRRYDPRNVYPIDGYVNPIDVGFNWIIHLFMEKTSHTKNIKWSTQIQYRDIQDISLYGRSVEISHSRKKPRNLTFRVGISDGERLYREFYLHYPAAIAKWRATLQEVFGPSTMVQRLASEPMEMEKNIGHGKK